MRDPQNIEDLAKLTIDYIGFIFYHRSPRYARYLEEADLTVLPNNVIKTGVFVNEIPSRLISYIAKFNLDAIQLHGDEDAHYCEFIKRKNQGLKIIKAFNISEPSDFLNTNKYEGICDYFLFDTKTSERGGSGQKFDWSVLESYTGNTPFFLSGGVSIDDIEDLKKLSHPQLYALDLNSKFETAPGIKDIELLTLFTNEIKL